MVREILLFAAERRHASKQLLHVGKNACCKACECGMGLYCICRAAHAEGGFPFLFSAKHVSTASVVFLR